MKKGLFTILIFLLILGCSVKKSNVAVADNNKSLAKNDTIRIANDSLHYELIILDAGFNSWLATAKPRSYYSLTFLETKNYFFVTQWNYRAMQPQVYDPNLYEMRIDYQSHIHYGLEVNYLLYNYFIYFQQRYKQKL